MPRGLSDLQKRVLLIVYERRMARDLDREREEYERRREEREREERAREETARVAAERKLIQEGSFGFSRAEWTPRPDIKMAELLAEVRGWPRSPSRWGSKNFSVRDIGRAEYNRGTTILHRSVGGLQRRGLLTAPNKWFPTEYLLTDEGVRVAERLSVESGQDPSPLVTDRGA